VRPRALVLATGTHDGVLAVPGNDLPGTFSARAVMRLNGLDIALHERAVLVGEGRFASAIAAALGRRLVARLAADDVVSIEGGSAVRAVVTRGGERIEVAAVLTDLPPAPAFELAAQAGAATRATPSGFAVDVDACGRAGPALWALGGSTGRSSGPGVAATVAGDVAAWLASAPSVSPRIG